MKATPRAQDSLKEHAGQLAQALPPLLLAAERVAEIVMHGVHGRRRAGPGDEFWQYRAHVAGDAVSLIDWRRSARAQRLFVREKEWMAASTLWLWVQDDAGMAWRSHMAEVQKRERALLLALALARLAQRGGERVAALDGPWRPDHTRASWERLAAWWLRRRVAGGGTNGNDRRLPPLARVGRFSSVVLIGDFFAAPRELMRRMVRLAQQGVRGHLLQVVDPAEEEFPYQGRVRFRDTDGERQRLVERAEDLRAGYRAALAQLRHDLGQQARRLGWTFQVHRTDQPPQRALLALYARLQAAPLAAHAQAAGERAP